MKNSLSVEAELGPVGYQSWVQVRRAVNVSHAQPKSANVCRERRKGNCVNQHTQGHLTGSGFQTMPCPDHF